MKLEGLDRSVAAQRFCRGFSPRIVRFLTGCTQNARFACGEYLFREGSAADSLFLLRSGSISLESHLPGQGALTLETLGAGDVLGWSVLFAPYQWHVDCRALAPVLALRVDGRCLRDKVEADSEFGYAITRQLLAEVHGRLERARLQQLDVYRAELGAAPRAGEPAPHSGPSPAPGGSPR